MAVGETSGQSEAPQGRVVPSAPQACRGREASPRRSRSAVKEADPEFEKLLDEEEAIASARQGQARTPVPARTEGGPPC